MDSGSSGSMQSSSGGGGGGGGEEYDSRGGESISSFLNLHPSGHFGSISNPQPPLLQPSHQQSSSHQPTFFDLHSQNLDAFPQSLATPNANVQYNNDMVWSRGLRSEDNYGNFGNLTSSSSLSSSTQSLLGAHQAPLASSSSMPLQSSVEGSATRASSSQLDHQPNIAVKNPKKRTRASRRAPTTVLTTDTTNFRQMVQEFTGIPAAPFSAGSPYSRRLDLFSTAGSGSAAMRAGQLDALGSLYPLRPSAQKVQLSPFIASSTSPSLLNSSVINAIVPNSNASSTNNTITTSIGGTSNFRPPKQTENILDMQNQLFTFQPLLQANLPPSLKLPMGNEPFFSTRSQGSTSMPSIDELGMSHQQQVDANLGGFSNQGSSEARQARNDENLTRWRDGGTLNNNGGGQEQLGLSFDGNDGNAQHVRSFKLNSSSSSDFYPEKVLENASSGGTEFRNYN